MRWYVYSPDEGNVWGPMSQSEANDMRDQLQDVCVFDDLSSNSIRQY